MKIYENSSVKIKKRLYFMLPSLLLLLVCMLFLTSINRISTETIAKEQTTLEQALRNGAVHTYALTGQYPESLTELLDTYHITYDDDKFVVEYLPNGRNLFPMISVLPMNHAKGGFL